jgi:hypothetical protein
MPKCDYLRVKAKTPASDGHAIIPNYTEIFKNAIRRVIVINKGKASKNIKFLDLINFIRTQKAKIISQ